MFKVGGKVRVREDLGNYIGNYLGGHYYITRDMLLNFKQTKVGITLGFT